MDESNEGAFGAGLSNLGAAEEPSHVVARYDQWVDDYETDVLRWGYRVPEVIAGMVGSEPGPILDAGCGTGLVGAALRAVLPAGVEIVGVDASPDSVTRAAAAGSYDRTEVVDLAVTLPMTDAAFAVVVCGGVLTYIDDTEAVLREFLRVTRREGRVIFSQRTDKWEERDCGNVIDRLVSEGACTADISDPQPYLPDLAEYGEAIKVIYTTLVVCGGE